MPLRFSSPSSIRTYQVCAVWIILAASLPRLLSAENTETQLVLAKNGSTIVLEPYAPNIIRVTLSMSKEEATAPPGYGFEAAPAPGGWSRQNDESGTSYRSSRMVVTVEQPHPGKPVRSQIDISKYFIGSTPGAHIRFTTPEGKPLLTLEGWSMSVPNYKDGNAGILREKRISDKLFYQVGATFVSPADEHYYGLGQNQEGYLDHRGHTVECWNNYDATGGPTTCVPFLVTNYGYGLLWDNPSKTTIQPGFNEQTRWTSEVGNRVSFFVIAGKTIDELYSGYRLLTGPTHLLPKAAYGFIQCKQRYSTQEEVMAVAKGYRQRHLPADVLVVDWFYFTKMGQMDMIPEKWPDPAAMNRELHEMGFQTMISIWPRFVPESRYYDLLLKNGWFEHLADGTPTNGLPYDRAGSDIDTTNPDAARWYWDVVRDNFVSKGFDAFWADETEPDLPPNGSHFHIGPGTRYFNVYPLFHTAAFYNGIRRDLKHRALILSRDAYIGAQRNGTIFWSSDIFPTWDTLRRQISTGLNFTASGIAYWGNDVGGWQYLPSRHVPEHKPLLDPSDARENVGGYDDYPELYTRWFEYGAFQPNFRTHGSRKYNEVWSYGKQAEPILEKYLRLRYQLLPYIYSLAWHTYESGAPFMRGLFMDFPNDPKVATIGDEYMFGPAILVAPVTEEGATSRAVYLPAGCDWYNFWTNERMRGGQMIEVNAPIDVLPLFVRAGSILPLGELIENTSHPQALLKVRVYPGAAADFSLYQDDGRTYAYEQGEYRITKLHWDDARGKLTHSGAAAWNGSDDSVIEVVGR
ncbi:MAG: glycoside hydrolase family 31 protein [Acidobacteriaceae bacterium]|nr:glycoside hydrolase family 31 protein [Acidobacteriaceae bacterium]